MPQNIAQIGFPSPDDIWNDIISIEWKREAREELSESQASLGDSSEERTGIVYQIPTQPHPEPRNWNQLIRDGFDTESIISRMRENLIPEGVYPAQERKVWEVERAEDESSLDGLKQILGGEGLLDRFTGGEEELLVRLIERFARAKARKEMGKVLDMLVDEEFNYLGERVRKMIKHI